MNRESDMNRVQQIRMFKITAFIIIFTLFSGCVITNYQQLGDHRDTPSIPRSTTPIQVMGKNLSKEQASENIRIFMSPQTIENLTYIKTNNKAKAVLFEFTAKNASFVVNPSTGRVQSATWTDSGPYISGITGDINQSCRKAGEYAREKYPELWTSDDYGDMDNNITKVWPLSLNTMYECAWYETLYYPAKKTLPHYLISGPNSIDIVLDPSSGKLHSYEETYTPLNPALSLKPLVSEGQAGELAIHFFEKNEIVRNIPSQQKNYGLGIFLDENDSQYLVWIMEIVQNRNATFGGLVYIDAHDGHIVYHATF